MDAQVFINSVDVSEYIVSIDRSDNYCDVSQTFSVSLPLNYSGTINPYEDIIIYEEGVKVLTGYVSTISKQAPQGLLLVSGEDKYKLAKDYFVDDTYTTDGTKTVSYWVGFFLDLVGLSYNFTDGVGPYVQKDQALGLSSIDEIIVPLLQYAGWYAKTNPNGAIVIGKLDKTPTNITLADGVNIINISTEKSTEKTRNIAKVYGTTTYNYLTEEITTVSGVASKQMPLLNVDQAVVATNQYITTQEEAQTFANQLIHELGNPTFIKTIDVVGNPNITSAKYINVNSDLYLGTALVTKLTSSFSESGYTMRLILDELCPRLIFHPKSQANLYVGTSGGGVYGYHLYENVWTALNSGLGSLVINDLSVSQQLFSAATPAGVYSKKPSETLWELQNLPNPSGYVLSSGANYVATYTNVFDKEIDVIVTSQESTPRTWLYTGVYSSGVFNWESKSINYSGGGSVGAKYYYVKQDGGGVLQIYSYDINAQTETPLTDFENADPDPTHLSVAFDESYIVFSATDGSDKFIYLLDLQGNDGVTKVTARTSGQEVYPAWSKDATKISYSLIVGTGTGLRTINADGTGDTLVTSTSSGRNTWNNYGTKLYFESGSDISEIDSDGNNEATLITDAKYPYLKPDGSGFFFTKHNSPITEYYNTHFYDFDTSTDIATQFSFRHCIYPSPYGNDDLFVNQYFATWRLSANPTLVDNGTILSTTDKLDFGTCYGSRFFKADDDTKLIMGNQGDVDGSGHYVSGSVHKMSLDGSNFEEIVDVYTDVPDTITGGAVSKQLYNIAVDNDLIVLSILLENSVGDEAYVVCKCATDGTNMTKLFEYDYNYTANTRHVWLTTISPNHQYGYALNSFVSGVSATDFDLYRVNLSTGSETPVSLPNKASSRTLPTISPNGTKYYVYEFLAAGEYVLRVRSTVDDSTVASLFPTTPASPYYWGWIYEDGTRWMSNSDSIISGAAKTSDSSYYTYIATWNPSVSYSLAAGSTNGTQTNTGGTPTATYNIAVSEDDTMLAIWYDNDSHTTYRDGGIRVCEIGGTFVQYEITKSLNNPDDRIHLMWVPTEKQEGVGHENQLIISRSPHRTTSYNMEYYVVNVDEKLTIDYYDEDLRAIITSAGVPLVGADLEGYLSEKIIVVADSTSSPTISRTLSIVGSGISTIYSGGGYTETNFDTYSPIFTYGNGGVIDTQETITYSGTVYDMAGRATNDLEHWLTTSAGVYKITNSGIPTLISNTVASEIEARTIGSGEVFISTSGTVKKSIDGGYTYSDISTGLPGDIITVMRLDD